MPLDLLIERLKEFDELMLVELLDITSHDILDRFRDKVIARQEYLQGEIEEFVSEEDDELDGFSIEDYNNEEE